jgi:DNA-binding transcriptional LysR family regulator
MPWAFSCARRKRAASPAPAGNSAYPRQRWARRFPASKTVSALGIGIACVPDFAVRRQIAEGSLVRMLESYIEHSGIFRAVWPSSHHLSPKLRAFVDYMAEHLFPKLPLEAAIMNGARVQLRAPSIRA